MALLSDLKDFIYNKTTAVVNAVYSLFKTAHNWLYPTTPEEAADNAQEIPLEEILIEETAQEAADNAQEIPLEEILIEENFEGRLQEENSALNYGVALNTDRYYTYPNQITHPSEGRHRAFVSFSNQVIEAYQDARKNITNTIERRHICILGMGPTGLMAGLRAYAEGASITLIDKRSHYTRENVLRMSQDFLFGPATVSQDFPHCLAKSIFLMSRDKIVSSSITNLMPLVPQGTNTDTVFEEEGSSFFHTISINHFENLLYTCLSKLQATDPEHITLHRGYDIQAIHAPAGEISIINRENDLSYEIKANWIVNATGKNGQLADGSLIIDALFPKTNEALYTPASSHAPYLATTLNINGVPGSHRDIVRGTNWKLPVAFTDGAAAYCEHHPELKRHVDQRVQTYQISSSHLRFANTLTAQRIFYGYHSQEAYYSNASITHYPGTDRAKINIDLACSYHGVLKKVQYIQREFGWTRNRLPLVRQLNSNTTIYLGMELSNQLFNELTSPNTSVEHKKIRFEDWVKTALRQFFPQDLLGKISIRQGSAFTLQMQTCNKITHRYPESHTQVFNLGDALATPHFLTGSGLESAAISVHHWIKYMQDGLQDAFIQNIQDNVQVRSLEKVNGGLGALSMFAPTTPDAVPQEHLESAPTVPINVTNRSDSPPQW
ncbi:MAG: hypothetical protein P1U36_00400 [Legionellaceae bacterium]|nr:hypothetical protein [Legionellaceae bacterium]